MSHASVIVITDEPSEEAIRYQMEPFREDGWFSDGSRWDWWQIGGRYSNQLLGKDQVQARDLDKSELLRVRAADLERIWNEAQSEKPSNREWLYGIKPTDTLESLIANATPLPGCAFLRARHWNEGKRMGWFGSAAKTECEIAGESPRVCTFTHKETGAKVICWNEDWRTWTRNLWDRFVAKLKPEHWVTMVDYHV